MSEVVLELISVQAINDEVKVSKLKQFLIIICITRGNKSTRELPNFCQQIPKEDWIVYNAYKVDSSRFENPVRPIIPVYRRTGMYRSILVVPTLQTTGMQVKLPPRAEAHTREKLQLMVEAIRSSSTSSSSSTSTLQWKLLQNLRTAASSSSAPLGSTMFCTRPSFKPVHTKKTT